MDIGRERLRSYPFRRNAAFGHRPDREYQLCSPASISFRPLYGYLRPRNHSFLVGYALAQALCYEFVLDCGCLAAKTWIHCVFYSHRSKTCASQMWSLHATTALLQTSHFPFSARSSRNGRASRTRRYGMGDISEGSCPSCSEASEHVQHELSSSPEPRVHQSFLNTSGGPARTPRRSDVAYISTEHPAGSF